MDSDIWTGLAVFFGIVGVMFVAVVAACLWEKRPVQLYYVPAEGEEYKPSAVAEVANRDAKRLGFIHGGLCHDGKGKLYRVRYDFWLSPDHSMLAVIGSGSIARIPVNGIWLWSRMKDGRIFCTTNEIGEQEICGLVEQRTWAKYSFEELLAKHEPRLSDEVEPFPTDSPLLGYFDIRRRKAEALVARGYAYYLDEEQKVWRYSLRGAVVFYFLGTWVRPIGRLLRSVGLVRE